MIVFTRSSGTMTTLLSRVKCFDSAKSFGCAAPNEPGHTDVFFTDAALRAAGVVVDPKRGTSLAVTFDASQPRPQGTAGAAALSHSRAAQRKVTWPFAAQSASASLM
jgi:cold shock CspA family protein